MPDPTMDSQMLCAYQNRIIEAPNLEALRSIMNEVKQRSLRHPNDWLLNAVVGMAAMEAYLRFGVWE